MDKVQFYHDKYYAQADRELSSIPFLCDLEQRFKVPKVYIAAGASAVGLLLVIFNFAGTLITNLVGFVYPAWCSFHAIETPGKEDDTQWLTYWTVFGLFNTAEYFTNILLYWIPFYYVLKLSILLWLALPQTRGAEYLYQAYLRPVFLHHSASINRAANNYTQNARSALDRAAEIAKAHSQ
ncbi:hypothetical protein H4R33_001662 [Dimargaris cristalligena]|uniref:Protein YOP1 n=1 Tax=Dimargaris cristalligena TaxID=215637 RepID=A0A4P9ZY64_9FUNG|nr:hypothetical protein H4R33_001662 [Dimargaris cristalligena]RKP38636.1 TB2/DP1, HVA22 family-domain-containing protein [Dimargaris cristalligena]|eukprot:RKP38636.1 TB2/DP1, HVA22 family-domain-containing protein [Dimargaris cristalligena]